MGSPIKSPISVGDFSPNSSGSAYPESEDYHYKFILHWIPESLCIFLPSDPQVPPVPDKSVKSYAMMQWKSAYISVWDWIRRKSLFWQLVRDKFAERHCFLDLAMRERCYITSTPQTDISTTAVHCNLWYIIHLVLPWVIDILLAVAYQKGWKRCHKSIQACLLSANASAHC